MKQRIREETDLYSMEYKSGKSGFGKDSMAKYERRLTGDFDSLVRWLNNDIRNGGISVTYEDGSDVTMGSVRTAVRVYERYSAMGGNRVSMNENDLFVSAITSGGSQAMFFKINTIGENTFLGLCENSVEEYLRNH